MTKDVDVSAVDEIVSEDGLVTSLVEGPHHPHVGRIVALEEVSGWFDGNCFMNLRNQIHT